MRAEERVGLLSRVLLLVVSLRFLGGGRFAGLLGSLGEALARPRDSIKALLRLMFA